MEDTYFKQFRCAGKSVLLNWKSGLIVSRFFDYYCELELARDSLLLMSGHLSGGEGMMTMNGMLWRRLSKRCMKGLSGQCNFLRELQGAWLSFIMLFNYLFNKQVQVSTSFWGISMNQGFPHINDLHTRSMKWDWIFSKFSKFTSIFMRCFNSIQYSGVYLNQRRDPYLIPYQSFTPASGVCINVIKSILVNGWNTKDIKLFFIEINLLPETALNSFINTTSCRKQP